MNPFSRSILACGLPLGLIGLLAVLLSAPAGAASSEIAARPAACAPANEIRVPDDCPTIQAALAVVYEQGQINVRETTDAASIYRENLVITRSVVIYGGWDDDFSESNGLSTVDAQRLGRGITISGTEELMVVIRALTVVSGTATELGGLTPSAAFEISEGYTGMAQAAIAAAETPLRGVADDDCGGGIYARNTHLRLYHVQVQDSIASTTGRGFGGGVCVVDVPDKNPNDMPPPFTPGVRIEEGSEIARNTASAAAEGAGGGVFASNAAGRIGIYDSKLKDNLGSAVASAYGGGAFGTKLASFAHGVSESAQNVASRSTDPAHFGRGGAIAVVETMGAVISNNKLENNVAAAATRGYGGGVYLRQTGNGFELRGTEYTNNRASAATNAAGYGGGLFLEDASNNASNFLRLNTFRGNVAAAGGQGGGGGVFVTDVPELKAPLNKFIGNRAVETAGTAASFGGGLALVNCNHPMIENNEIAGNMAAAGGAAASAVHRGGGVYLSHTDELLFGENQIITNTAGLKLPGEGGGVYLAESTRSDERLLRILGNVLAGNQASQGGGMLIRNAGEALVRHNRFIGNAATFSPTVGANAGGGLLVDQTSGASLTVTVDRNHFLRNTAGPMGTAGGGAAIMGISDLTLVNNVFAGNVGVGAAGLYLAAHPTAQQSHEAANNTFDGNAGPAIGVQGWNNPPFTFYNTIIAHGPVGVQVLAGAAVVVDYTLWHETPARGEGGGAFSDLHPVTGDPVFAGAANDDYHLRMTSAARDAGDPAGIPPAPEVDLASAKRPFGPQVDIGAYEWRDTVHWPNDYPLLKDAIDAARPGDGDTILALGRGLGGTEEQLRITKSITLSGGWDAEFKGRSPSGPTFWINQPGTAGRFLTIEGGPGVVVKIEGFSFSNGDATGLGGIPDSLAAPRTPSKPTSDLRGLADPEDPSSETVRGIVAQLGARGKLPVEAISSVETLLSRLDTVAQEDYPARAAAAPQAETDCGGAIYSKDAGFYLSESYFEKNIASKTGEGYGGAVCVLDAPAGQLVVQDAEMRYNIASARDSGAGGGLFIANAPQARLSGLNLYLNVASAQGAGGEGGALLVNESDGVALSDSVFDGNIALGLWGGEIGTGGGAQIWASNSAQISGNTFRGNLGGPMCITCRGGGLYLGRSRDVRLAENQFSNNIAGFMEWAVGTSGGGLALDALTASQVLSNTFTNNSAGVNGARYNAGGGIYGIVLDEVLFAGNTLTGNWATQVGAGHGGGVYIEPSSIAPSQNVTLRGNRFIGNAASLSGNGLQMAGGGGVELFLTTDSVVKDNRFEGNQVGPAVAGFGGGLLLRASIGELGGDQPAINTIVDGNTFINNTAEFGESSGGGMAGSGVKAYTVINNVFAGNRSPYGGALSMNIKDSTVGPFEGAVVNNTLYNNSDQGIFLYGENRAAFVISNTIIVSQAVGVHANDEDTHVALAYTLWNDVAQRTNNPDWVQDTHPVTGPVSFVDAAVGNFRIRLDSAARDAGDPVGVPPAPDHDADGAKRPFGARVDIGAYEWRGVQIFMPMVRKMAAPYIGWAVGDAADGFGTILRTTDSGATWVRQGSPADVPDVDLNAVSAVDAANAWVVGAHGVILRTRNGGQTWERQTAPAGLEDVEFHGVKALDGVTAFAVGAPDALAQTTDGQTWQVSPRAAALNLAWPVNYADVDAVDATHAWAVGGTGSGGRGVAVIAFWDGVQWRRQAPDLVPDEGSHVWIGVSALDRHTVWAVGGWQLPLAKTTDGGANWQTVGPDLSTGDMNRVVAVTADVGWAAGDYGVAQRTLDGGQSWSRDPTGTGSYLYAVSAVSAEMAWVVGPNENHSGPGWLLRTQNGRDWEAQPAPVSADIAGLSFVGARR